MQLVSTQVQLSSQSCIQGSCMTEVIISPLDCGLLRQVQVQVCKTWLICKLWTCEGVHTLVICEGVHTLVICKLTPDDCGSFGLATVHIICA